MGDAPSLKKKEGRKGLLLGTEFVPLSRMSATYRGILLWVGKISVP